jgi:sulfur-carrier protein adenylyltransferase/sulfurtransferase
VETSAGRFAEQALPTPEQERRYGRQIPLPVIGPEGQARLGRSRAAVVGCGGLGSVLSQIMVRMGVGRVTGIDGDRPDISNLHR